MNIHFSGIGGIGMSALARYFLSLNFLVSGSDSSASDLTDELKKEGVKFIPDTEVFSEQVDMLVYSEAIPENDIQRSYAKKNNIKSLSYFQCLGELSKEYKTLAVCGTHGKSTTTAMLGIALDKTDMSPLVIVGTKVKEFGGKNICLGIETPLSPHFKRGEIANEDVSLHQNNDIFIVEACEYRGSFLSLHPFGVLLINCEHDHMDYYKTEKSYLDNFKKFIEKIPKDGFLIANFDDENVKAVSESARCKVIPVYFSQIKNPICPKVPGEHNKLNAQMAYEAGVAIVKNLPQPLFRKEGSYTEKILRESLENFSGTWRRFDILAEKNAVTVIDDYAHHPTEISVTLKALDEYAKGRRIILVFQPHQYSRTRELFHEFVEALSSVIPPQAGIHIAQNNNIKILITDIYEARDTQEDKDSVSSEILVEAINKKGGDAMYSGDYDVTLKKLEKILQKNDILVTMGAGPVNMVAEEFLGFLDEREYLKILK